MSIIKIPKTVLDYNDLINICLGFVAAISAVVAVYNISQFDLYTTIATIILFLVIILIWHIWRNPPPEAKDQKRGWSDKLARWIITRPPEIFLVVLFTLIVAAFFSAFPIPAPEMAIIVPHTSFPLNIIVTDTGVKGWNGAIIDVNVTASPDIWRYILYDSEFLQRVIKNLHWEPKIWVMVRKEGESKWTPFFEVQDFIRGYYVQPITLYVPINWSVDVVSMNERDDQFIKDYILTVKETKGNLLPIDRLPSQFSKTSIKIRTYDATNYTLLSNQIDDYNKKHPDVPISYKIDYSEL